MKSVKLMICSGKTRVNLHKIESHGVQSAVGLVKIYSENTVKTAKHGECVMYVVSSVLLDFSSEIRKILIFHGHTIVRFLPVKIQEGGDDVKEFERVDCSETGGTDLRSQLVVVED